MKILLIGEYSRLHNSLKEGLVQLGHEVVIVGYNDGFKNYTIDFSFSKKWDTGFLKKIKMLLFKTTSFDISSFFTYLQFKKLNLNLSNFDVVQLINENSFFCDYHFEKKILNLIFEKNKKVFLLSCGDDYANVNYNFENLNKKSILQPYLNGKIKDKDFFNVLKFRNKNYKKLHHFIYSKICGVIATDLDYHFPLIGKKKYRGLVANPVNIDKIKFETLNFSGKIIIFLGINRESYFKKGLDFFEKALEIIKKKYSTKVEIIVVENVPYETYSNLYNKAHILLDQVYAFDQGYNALEAMAKGKVVFTGAEKEFEIFYNLTKSVAINALPNVDYLVEKISFLIENPDEIEAIGIRARNFIKKEHDYVTIASKYLEKWL